MTEPQPGSDNQRSGTSKPHRRKPGGTLCAGTASTECHADHEDSGIQSEHNSRSTPYHHKNDRPSA